MGDDQPPSVLSYLKLYFETTTEPVGDNDNKTTCTLNHLIGYALLHAFMRKKFSLNWFEVFKQSSLFSLFEEFINH